MMNCFLTSVQATWNLLESSAAPALEGAHQAGMNVIVKESLANGRLTSRNDEPTFQERRKELETVASEFGSTVDAIAIAAALNQSWATTVLSGAASVAHLQSNLKANEVPWSQELAERLSGLQETSESYWTARSNLAWN